MGATSNTWSLHRFLIHFLLFSSAHSKPYEFISIICWGQCVAKMENNLLTNTWALDFKHPLLRNIRGKHVIYADNTFCITHSIFIILILRTHFVFLKDITLAKLSNLLRSSLGRCISTRTANEEELKRFDEWLEEVEKTENVTEIAVALDTRGIYLTRIGKKWLVLIYPPRVSHFWTPLVVLQGRYIVAQEPAFT